MLDDRAFESEADALAVVGVELGRRLEDVAGVLPIAWATILPGAALTDQVPAGDSAIPGTSAPAIVRRYRWVIRTDDLKLVEALLDAIKVLIPTGILFPVVGPVAATGAIGAVVVEGIKLLKRMRDKGARVDERSFVVLCLLEKNGPIRFDAFLPLLRAYDLSWTDAELSRVLEELKAYPSSDGSGLALVKASADGQEWRATKF
jgi:hypothetical protein